MLRARRNHSQGITGWPLASRPSPVTFRLKHRDGGVDFPGYDDPGLRPGRPCARESTVLLRWSAPFAPTDIRAMNRSSKAATATSLPFLAASCVTALALAVAGCTGHAAAAGGGGGKNKPSSTATAKAAVTSTVQHWGAFFGRPAGSFNMTLTPATVTVPGTIAEVGTSNSTQYALLTDGSVYAWGMGTSGQLGNGARQNSFTTAVRVQFPAGVKIASIPDDVMPYDTALAVDTRGNAWGWGGNAGGELCLGDKGSRTVPVKLPFSHVTTLAGASGHAVYDAGGVIYACGLNRDGVLGDGSRRSSLTRVRVAKLHGAKVTKLVAGFDNAGALLSNGDYYDWGYNADGQLGDRKLGPSSSVPVKVKLPGKVVQVVQGGSIWHNGQTLAMLSDGALWSWGDNRDFQLGDHRRRDRATPVRFRAPPGVTYRTLATGGLTSYAISTTGQVWAWGGSSLGEVGNGKTRSARSPVMVATGADKISSTANNVLISVPNQQ
jgi:alpha-tubulin suppressor-like RCC1 family protein